MELLILLDLFMALFLWLMWIVTDKRFYLITTIAFSLLAIFAAILNLMMVIGGV